MDSATLTPWSLQHARPVGAVEDSPEVPHTIAVSAARPRAPVLCAQSWLCRVDLDVPSRDTVGPSAPSDKQSASGGGTDASEAAPLAASAAHAKVKKSRKRRRGGGRTKEGGGDGDAVGGSEGSGGGARDEQCHVVRNYGGVLLFSFLGDDAAVVVEQPWLRVMDHFPPALYKHRFGT